MVTGMLWEATKVGRVGGCLAPWHKQAPGNHSHLHKYSLNMRDGRKEYIHTIFDRQLYLAPTPSSSCSIVYNLQSIILSFYDRFTERESGITKNKAKSSRVKRRALTNFNIKFQVLQRTELFWEDG